MIENLRRRWLALLLFFHLLILFAYFLILRLFYEIILIFSFYLNNIENFLSIFFPYYFHIAFFISLLYCYCFSFAISTLIFLLLLMDFIFLDELIDIFIIYLLLLSRLYRSLMAFSAVSYTKYPAPI